MSYSVFPDVTVSDLNIGHGGNEKSNLSMTQFGGGVTLSESIPIYLEGAMGYSRYDPQFVLSVWREYQRLRRWSGHEFLTFFVFFSNISRPHSSTSVRNVMRKKL